MSTTNITRVSAAALALLLVAAGAGCSGDIDAVAGDPYPGSGGQNTNPYNNGNPPPATTGGGGGAVDPQQQPPGCGGQTIPIELKQNHEIPDLHLVVDKSGSMQGPISLFDFFRSKWIVMRDALSALVDTFQFRVRFGLTLYPADEGCQAGQIDVPLQMGNEPQIKQRLQLGFTDGWTPTHTTLAGVRAYLPGVPLGSGPRYVLLATDGIPNCGDEPETESNAQTLAEVQALAAQGVRVFVVGFGDIVMSNPGLLDQLALAGGVPNPNGPFKFYPATNEQELKDAMFAIAAGIVPPPCTYRLTSRPDDPDLVTVTFDGQPVPRSQSSTAGWNYTAGGAEISFFGDACKQLQSGQVKQVQFYFGCKGPVIK